MPNTINDLRAIGLSDTEIAILARTYDGMSRADMADVMHLSPVTVANYYYSARRKLTLAGKPCPKPRRGRPRKHRVMAAIEGKPRVVNMDPAEMDKRFVFEDRYNANL
jgi:DNA-binding CsgD family transcriptional regulator